MLSASTESGMADFIQRATRRLVVIAPGVSTPVAQSIIRTSSKMPPGSAQVCLDADPDVVRLGYGTLEGMSLLFNASKDNILTVNRMVGLRIGVIIADDATMVFAPTPLAIELPNEERAKPNALVLDAHGVNDHEQVLDDIGHTGTIRLTAEEFDRTKKNLELNPPVPYDVSRSIRVFNTKYDFVELTVTGCEVSRRTLPLPPELLGFSKSDLSKRVRGKFTLLGDDDASRKFDNSTVLKMRKDIEKRFFIVVPTFGCLIRKEQRSAFETEVKKLTTEVEKLQKAIEAGLQDHLNSMQKELVGVLFESAKRDMPESWVKFLGSTPSDDDIRKQIGYELEAGFHKGCQDLVKSMQVHVIFKGITWELLNSAKFREKLASSREGQLVLDRLHDEWQAAPERPIQRTISD